MLLSAFNLYINHRPTLGPKTIPSALSAAIRTWFSAEYFVYWQVYLYFGRHAAVRRDRVFLCGGHRSGNHSLTVGRWGARYPVAGVENCYQSSGGYENVRPKPAGFWVLLACSL